MNIKKYFLNNFGLKVSALILAVVVWGIIAGKARSSTEKTMEVNVECINVSQYIDIISIRPEKVRITFKGTAKDLEKLTPENVKIKIDLKEASEGTRNYFTENYLQIPDGIQDSITVHHRMIYITAKEFISRSVPIRVHYKGTLNSNLRLVDRRIIPDKAKIFGYKSQLNAISSIETDGAINLSEIKKSTTIRLPLHKTKDIVRVENSDYVDVFIEIEEQN